METHSSAKRISSHSNNEQTTPDVGEEIYEVGKASGLCRDGIGEAGDGLMERLQISAKPDLHDYSAKYNYQLLEPNFRINDGKNWFDVVVVNMFNKLSPDKRYFKVKGRERNLPDSRL